MSIAQFFALSSRGDAILSKDFRGDVAADSTETFIRKVKFWATGDAPPAFHVDGVNYLYVKKNGLYFVATTRFNVSPSTILELLKRICCVFKDFCGELSEETLRKNFVLCYELLDETLDFGFAQDTNILSLKAFVHEEVVRTPKISIVSKPGLIYVGTAPPTTTENVIFCDVLEHLNVTLSPSGKMLNAFIEGEIQVDSYLKGNPELRVALNEDLVIGASNHRPLGNTCDQVVLDDCNFHECVQLDEFDRDRVLTFTPPDGEFTVMNYRLTGDFRSPFKIFPFVEETSPTKIEMVIMVWADMPDTNYGTNVILRFPVPQSTIAVSCELGNNGTSQLAEFRKSENEVRWAIKRFDSTDEFTLRTKITLKESNLHARREIGPISMNFEIPMYNASTLQVRYLRIPEHARHPNYVYKRWLRYHADEASRRLVDPVPPPRLFRGINVGDFFNETSYTAFCALAFEPSDILALTPAKCGTTYLHKILYLLTRLNDKGLAAETDTSVIAQGQFYPEWMHDKTGHPPFPDHTLDEVLYQPSPRIFSSHMRADMVPAIAGRVVCMLRNPKDAYVSLHFMRNKLSGDVVPWLSTPTTTGSYQGYLPGKALNMMYGDFFGYVRHLQAYADAHVGRVLVLYYEEMLQAFDTQLTKLAAFLELPLTAAKRAAITRQASFQSMQAENAHSRRAFLFRKGTTGDWKSYVGVDTPHGPSPTAEQWAAFDEELATLRDLPLAQPLYQWMH
ncbi:AP-4 complex subunit mu-1 [Achlya hypogyna]|uniref:AP-4 complex subunit mu-1 n=1 Tax=Achlya hypogyna TaxID=1202772 RepID=A0A1V9YG15_ACHHY|nr:AP-4 complex subunit mu-1 [Achlya hypogyna]